MSASIAGTGNGDRYDDPQALENAIELHDRGVEGSEAAVDKAIEALDALLDKDPENELARAYLGSAYTLKARDAALWRKRGWVEKGIETLDTAVQGAPANSEVRLVRAINAYNLPRMAGRYDLAAEDFELLLESLDQDADSFEPAFKRAVFFHAGAFALKENENKRAVSLLEKAGAVEGTTRLADEIESMLRLARNRVRNL